MVLCRETRLTGCSVAPSPTIAPGRVETRLPRPVLSIAVGVPLSSSSEMPVCNRAVVCQKSCLPSLSKQVPFGDAPPETLRVCSLQLFCSGGVGVPRTCGAAHRAVDKQAQPLLHERRCLIQHFLQRRDAPILLLPDPWQAEVVPQVAAVHAVHVAAGPVPDPPVERELRSQQLAISATDRLCKRVKRGGDGRWSQRER